MLHEIQLILEVVFYTSLFVVGFGFVGYPAMSFILSRFKPQQIRPTPDDLPTLTVVIPAYNESEVLVAKLRNTHQLDYPTDKLRVVVVTDGSTDDSPVVGKMVGSNLFKNFKLMHQPEKRGKVAAVNRAMEIVNSEITVWTDADTQLNTDALINLASHFSDPKIGLVGGSKTVKPFGSDSDTEGLYWKYENAVKNWDSRLGDMQGAAGELLAFRTSAYEHMPQSILLDDFVLAYKIRLKGLRVKYEPEAIATELPTQSWKEEWKRKIRICAGGWQALFTLPKLLRFWKHPLLTFQYLGHRILRWTLVPIAFVTLWASALLLFNNGNIFLFSAVLLTLWLINGLLNIVAPKLVAKLPGSTPMFYLLMMQTSAFVGAYNYLTKPTNGNWVKTKKLTATS